MVTIPRRQPTFCRVGTAPQDISLKVLVAHNKYQSAAPSGENQIVDAEIALLLAGGVEVASLLEESDSLIGARPAGLLRAGLGSIYSPSGTQRFKALMAREKPDVVHLHNVFPLLSPWVVRVAAARRVPVVQTVHNYRHTCVNGLHVRDGKRCDDCIGRSVPWPAVRHSCYRDSALQSLPMAASQVVHRGTWRSITQFVVLTPFMGDRLARYGVSPERITIRPTWVPDVGRRRITNADLVYLGRLDDAKGIPLLLDAWRKFGTRSRRLFIAGDGPLREMVEEASLESAGTIRYLGRVPPAAIGEVLALGCAVVIPSIFYEGFPLTLAEAFSAGRPVIVMEGGSPASVVTSSTGWLAPLDAGGLADTFERITQSEAESRGYAARALYEASLSPQAAFASLMRVYESAIDSVGRQC